MRLGIVDLDTSHPQNWIPIERELGHEVIGIYDAGAVHPPSYVEAFAQQHQVPKIYSRLEDMVLEVDGVIIHSCDWDTHVDKARPFVEADKSVLLDKPMAGSLGDIQQLLDWDAQGKRVCGGSSLRYAAEVAAYLAEPPEERGVAHTAFAGCGTDEFNYGIHAYALLAGALGPGMLSAQYLGSSRQKHIRITWDDGRVGLLCIGAGAWLPFHLTLVTERKVRQITCDTGTLYRGMLEQVLPYMAGAGEPMPPMRQLLEPELCALAARQSWLRRGAEVFLTDLTLADEGYDGALFAREYRRQRYPEGQ